MKKRQLKQDINLLSEYIDELASDLMELQEKLNSANSIIAKQNNHITMLDKQLLQAEHYLGRKDEENSVLKRMYRDDIINGYIER